MNAVAKESGPGPSPNRARMYKVVTPIERKDGGTFWMRVGTGYTNKDASMNVYLDAMPANLKFQIREMEEDDFQPRRRAPDGVLPKADGPAQRSLNDIPF